MGRGVANARLTKAYILSKVSQELIASTYLDIPIETVEWCVQTGRTICSPLRNDEHPSFGFAYNNKGQLKARDFAGYFWGDVWDIIAYVLSNITGRELDVSNKHDFMFCLKHCAYTFKNIIYGKDKDERVLTDINNAITTIKNKKSVIEVAYRSWNNNDKNYWARFGISLGFLNSRFVYPVQEYWINRKVNPESKYVYDKNDPCYAYLLGQDSRGIYNWKLYFPKRSHNKVRFITNCNHIEGVWNLELDNYDIVVITKSSKDRISLDEFIHTHLLRGVSNDELSIGVVNIPSETHILTKQEYDFIRNKTSMIVSLFDNDRAGYICAIKYRDDWNIFPIIIPRSYEAKDFAELRSLYSDDTILNLINETIKIIEDERERRNQFIRDKVSNSSLPY